MPALHGFTSDVVSASLLQLSISSWTVLLSASAECWYTHHEMGSVCGVWLPTDAGSLAVSRCVRLKPD